MPNQRRRLLIPCIAIGLSLAAAGCGDDSDVATGGAGRSASTTSEGSNMAPSGPTSIEGAWDLVSYAGEDGPEAATGAGLRFAAEGQLSGRTGCNNLVGSYTASDSDLAIELGPLTMMACVDEAAERQERAVLDGLALVATYLIEGGQLHLADGDGDELFTFDPGVAALEGTTWRVSGVNTGSALESSALTEELTAEFSAEGAVTGSGGCNTFQATFTTDGDAVTISDLSSTMMACEPDVSTLEQQYFAALEAVTTFEITGERLTLRDDSGAMHATFESAG